MKPTDELKEEREAILSMLKVIGAFGKRLDAGETVPPPHLAQVVAFIRLSADRRRHGKEEDLLFTATARAGVPRDGGLVGVMLAEHDEGRGYVREMATAAAGFARLEEERAGPGKHQELHRTLEKLAETYHVTQRGFA